MSEQNADVRGTGPVSPVSATLAEIEEVARLRAERDHLTERHRVAKRDAERSENRVLTASAALEKEKADVLALENMSMTRVLASLRGRRLDDLQREQDEVRAAEYSYAVEHARWQDLLREEAELVRRLNALGLLDVRWQRALDDREAEVDSGSPTGVRLRWVGERLGIVRADRREVDEAVAASAGASQALQAAGTKLSSAGSWATYDTFFGGGLVADMVKHQHLDEASALIRAADQALHHLGTELADVGIAAVGGLGISDMSRTFDVWFDNIFSDFSVAEKIRDAQRRVDQTLRALAGLDQELFGKRNHLDAEEQQLRAEREQLLST